MTMLVYFRFLFVVGLLGSLSGCESRTPATSATPAAPVAAPVAEARYECPMKCAGSQSDKPGKCPVCEMDLVKKS